MPGDNRSGGADRDHIRSPSGPPATNARLDATVVLLLQLRLLLTAVALLLLPNGRAAWDTFALVCAFALLTWLASRFWGRLRPPILRHPWLAAGDAVVAAAILVVDGPTGPFFMATVLTSTIVGTLFGWRGLAGIASFQVVCYLAAFAAFHGVATDFTYPGSLQILVIHPLLYPIAGFVGTRLRAIFAELEREQLARQSAERSAASAEAIAEERARLARDMHDSLAKTLRGTAMAAQALPLWVQRDPERAGAEAERIAEAANTAVNEARGLISDLRDHQRETPITERITAEVGQWSRETGIPAPVRIDEPEGRPFHLLVLAEQETVSILGEALTNVDRHAEASMVNVDVFAEEGHLIVRLVDDGRGFGPVEWDGAESSPAALPEPVGHYGLLGMHERARHAGGSLVIRSAPRKGSTITIRMPLAAGAGIDTPGPGDEAALSSASSQ